MAAIMMVSLDSAATQSCGALVSTLTVDVKRCTQNRLRQCKHKPSSGVVCWTLLPPTLAEVSADNQPSVQAA